MRYHARGPCDGVAFPPAPHSVGNGRRAGDVGRLFGSLGTDVRLRRPVVVVIWWDDHAPLEWNRQPTEHAGLTSNCRHRVIRQRRTERQKHPCPLPQPIERSGAVANLYTPTGHIVRQTEENMRELPILIRGHLLNGARAATGSAPVVAEHRRPLRQRRGADARLRRLAGPTPVGAQRLRVSSRPHPTRERGFARVAEIGPSRLYPLTSRPARVFTRRTR